MLLRKLLGLQPLISIGDQATATGLSAMMDGAVSHDQITRFLSKDDFDSKRLWKKVKPTVREIQSEDGCIIFDDTIVEKEWTDESDIICWHFDHAKGRNVKGVNLLNMVYCSQEICVPVGFEVVRKYAYCEIETKKQKRKADVGKNELMRNLFQLALKNQILLTTDTKLRMETIRMRIDHIFPSIMGILRLKYLKIKQHLNCFTLKSKLHIRINQIVFVKLRRLKGVLGQIFNSKNVAVEKVEKSGIVNLGMRKVGNIIPNPNEYGINTIRHYNETCEGKSNESCLKIVFKPTGQ